MRGSVIFERDSLKHFGEYFKKLRKSRGFTQEQIDTAIGKSKMLINGVGTGRNGAFVDRDLEAIARILEFSTDERNKLFFEASKISNLSI